MPLPETLMHAGAGYTTLSDPSGTTLLFRGLIGTTQSVTVFGKIHDGELIFCISLITMAIDAASASILHTSHTQKWATSEEYQRQHANMWGGMGLHSDEAFTTDAGTGDTYDDESEICWPDGRLKMGNIRARCA